MNARTSITLYCRAVCLGLSLILTACASLPPQPLPVEWQAHADSLSTLEGWTLNGRLNIRQEGQSDTVNLNWSQDGEQFSIRLSGTFLGLGAVRLQGDEQQVLVDRAGQETRVLPGLEALSREYLDYDFPAAYLLWWVRGLPVPGLPVQNTFNEQNLLHTLIQASPDGQRYELAYERYGTTGDLILPSRFTLQSQGVLLRFLIDRWQLPQQVP